MTSDACSRLFASIPPNRLEQGRRRLDHVHERIRDLVRGALCTPLDRPEDFGYGSWHLFQKSPQLDAIAADGWPERHLQDFALLAESPALGDCCRATLLELFGVDALHVAIQFFPISDGLVQSICHESGDKRAIAKRIASELTNYRVAYGSYSPPSPGFDCHVATHGPAVDLLPYHRHL